MNKKSKPLTNVEKEILDILTRAEEPIPTSWFIKSFGITEREVRSCMANLSTAQKPVCSHKNGKGYFLATSIEELEKEINSVKSRKNKLSRRLYGLNQAKRSILHKDNSLFVSM